MVPINNTEDKSHESGPLTGRVALVTGGSRGIGRAIAQKLSLLGASVSICGRDSAALKSVAQELSIPGVPLHFQIADVTKSADISNLVAQTECNLGPISILVNNAGIGLFGPTHEKSEADWDRLMNTNLKSVFLISRAVVPSMIRRGSGDIVNISSLAGKNTFAGGDVYCASKWGLMGLTGCMAEELREHGVRVSVVCPGSVLTEFSGRSAKDPTRVLAAQDVAHAVAAIVTQGPQSFLSEIHLRPLRKA